MLRFLLIISLIYISSCNKVTIESKGKSESFTIKGTEISHSILPVELESTQTNTTKEQSLVVKESSKKGSINKIKFSQQIEKKSGKVDMVLSLDNSGSMKNEIDMLKANLKNFISNFDPTLDVHLTVVYANTGSSAAYSESNCFKFFPTMLQSARDLEIKNAETFIDALPILGAESPIYWGLQAYTNDNKTCFRADSYKYLLVMGDEDERKPGDGGNSVPTAATISSYKTDLGAKGIEVSGVIHTTPVVFKDVINALGGQIFPFPTDATSLATSLKEYVDKINTVATGYRVSTEPIHPESLYITINSTLVAKENYSLSKDGKTVIFKDNYLNDAPDNTVLDFYFLLPGDLTDSVNGAKIETSINSAARSSCASVSGTSVNLWNCIKDDFSKAETFNYEIFYLPKSISIKLDPNAMDDKSHITVSKNDIKLEDASFTYSNKKVVVKYATYAYNSNDIIKVKYHIDANGLSQGIIEVNLASPVDIKLITVNDQEIDSTCYEFKMWEPVVKISDCLGLIENSEDFEIKIKYLSGGKEMYVYNLPDDYAKETPVIASNGDTALKSDFYKLNNLPEAQQILFTEDESLLNKSIKVKYFSNSAFVLKLQNHITDPESLELYLNGVMLDKADYDLGSLKPTIITVLNKEKIKFGDEIECVFK